MPRPRDTSGAKNTNRHRHHASIKRGKQMKTLGNDFRSFLQEVKAKFPTEYVEIDKEVSGTYETTAIVTKLEMQKRTPILFFKKVAGTEFPVVVNACASRSVVAASLGVGKDDLSDKYLHALKHMIKPVVVARGPVDEVGLTGDQIN